MSLQIKGMPEHTFLQCSDHHSQKGQHLDHEEAENKSPITKEILSYYGYINYIHKQTASVAIDYCWRLKDPGCAAHTCISSSAACSWNGRRRRPALLFHRRYQQQLCCHGRDPPPSSSAAAAEIWAPALPCSGHRTCTSPRSSAAWIRSRP